MTAWAPIFLPTILGFLIIAALGSPVAFGLRAKGFSFALIAVPAAFAAMAVASLITPLFGIRWSLLPPAVISILLGVVLWIITRRSPSARGISTTRSVSWPVLGTVMTGLILTFTFVKSVPGAAGISQTYDGVFHLNAVQYILHTGSASPLDLDLASPGRSVFYPSLWHAFVVLLVQISGAEITVATNAAAIVVLVAVWSVGAIGLGRAVAGSGLTATVVSSITAAAFSSFPLMFLSYGVLFPNLLSNSLLTYALVAILHIFQFSRARYADRLPTGAAVLLLLGALGAATFAHPNALHSMLVISLPFVLFALGRSLRARVSMTKRIFAIFGTILLISSAAPLWAIASRNSTPWGGSEGPFGAMIEALGTNPIFEGHNWVLTLIVLVGLAVSMSRTGLRPWAVSLVLVVGLFIAAEGFPPSGWRSTLLSPWYADPWRLAGLLPLVMIPLAAIGGTLLAASSMPTLRRWIEFFTSNRRTALTLSYAVVYVVGIAIIGTSLFGVSGRLDETYLSVDEDARVLSPDEQMLIERIDEHVPEGTRLMANPWSGTSLTYALADREVLLPHLSGTYPVEVWQAMNGITHGESTACDAADSLNTRFVLDFGTSYVFKAPEGMRPELEEISAITYAPALTEIDREGDAVLYEITGCDWKDSQ